MERAMPWYCRSKNLALSEPMMLVYLLGAALQGTSTGGWHVCIMLIHTRCLSYGKFSCPFLGASLLAPGPDEWPEGSLIVMESSSKVAHLRVHPGHWSQNSHSGPDGWGPGSGSFSLQSSLWASFKPAPVVISSVLMYVNVIQCLRKTAQIHS